MTHLELFTELLAEMLGIQKTHLPKHMAEYRQYVASNCFCRAKVSEDDAAKIREAISDNPQIYLSWFTDEHDHITKH